MHIYCSSLCTDFFWGGVKELFVFIFGLCWGFDLGHWTWRPFAAELHWQPAFVVVFACLFVFPDKDLDCCFQLCT